MGVEKFLGLSKHFPFLFPVSTGWCSVSMWETNLGLQDTKLLLFSTAYQGLQNCMLCQNYSTGLAVN